MSRAFIAFGTNLGNRESNIRAALEHLDRPPDVQVLKVSRLLENPAVGMKPDSPPFLNGVAELQTVLSPLTLMHLLLQIEQTLGRVRNFAYWTPRTIDLDLLVFDDQVMNESGLILPHPRMSQRRFVLQPLVEIAPQLVHPILKKSISELLDDLEQQSQRP